jgi:hypothetical protein
MGILAHHQKHRDNWIALWSISIAPKVAANYYGKTRNTTMAEFAERSSNSPDEILNWYGYWMAIHGVRIFGKRPPSPNIDQVPQDDIGRSLHFKNGASELWEHYKTHPTFSDLSVKWGDLIKHRKVLLGRGSNQKCRRHFASPSSRRPAKKNNSAN